MAVTIVPPPREHRAPPTERGARVEVTGVYKAFQRLPVLRGIDLDLAPGTFTAIVGRSGCGKSTLLRLVAGLETATAGGVTVDGKPLVGLHPDARVMFQDARLMPWMRVRDNVGLGLEGAWRDRAASALADVGLGDRGGEWPAVLSGGQRQRVALARALASAPRLLLLDEPLGALDALTRRSMQNLIERLWRQHGFTTLLITHDAEEAVALADRVILIEEGRVAVDLAVDLPRPRDRSAPELIALREKILRHIHNAEDPQTQG